MPVAADNKSTKVKPRQRFTEKKTKHLQSCHFFYVNLHLQKYRIHATLQRHKQHDTSNTHIVIFIKMNYSSHIAEQLGLGQRQVEKTIELL